jgi:hypothetical protein
MAMALIADESISSDARLHKKLPFDLGRNSEYDDTLAISGLPSPFVL